MTLTFVVTEVEALAAGATNIEGRIPVPACRDSGVNRNQASGL
jgi:hypothetical protein